MHPEVSLLIYLALLLNPHSIIVFVCCENALNPVILVSGLGGSQMEARLNRTEVVHYICRKKSDWYQIWISLEQLEMFTECFVDNMRLNYDEKSHRTRNQEGVEIRSPEFGNTSSVEWLDPFHIIGTNRLSYFYKIVEYLATNLSYKRGVSIRGAPYDFRKAPNEMAEYFIRLKDLIEETYSMNDNRRIVLIGHSMGNNYLLYFLNNQSRDWKEKYIVTYISLAAPWIGSVKPLLLMTSGDSLNLTLVKPIQLRQMERSFPSVAWLMPRGSDHGQEVLVYAPDANFTAYDYKEYFEAIGYPVGFQMRRDTENINEDLRAPDVEVHCLFGEGVVTARSYDYRNVPDKKNWFDHPPVPVFGDGDGTVNRESLHACQKWKKEQARPVHLRTFNKVDHQGMLKSDDVISYIDKVLRTISGPI